MTALRRSYLFQPGENYVMVPARIAALVEARTKLSALRVQIRGLDPEASQVLEDLHQAALIWRGSVNTGTIVAVTPEPDRELVLKTEQPVSTSRAADLLGMTDRGIRKALAAGRLQGNKKHGKWEIQREDLRHFEATRAA